MARHPKPWFRYSRGAWFVTINGKQHNLGPDKQEAFKRFYSLMQQPQATRALSESLPAIADSFLDWVQRNRAPDTFEWYRYRLERICQRYPNMRLSELKPFHVQEWVDSYPNLSRTSRRNYIRAVKRCCRWAVQQGYLTTNPIEHMEVPGADRRETLISIEDYQQLLALIRDDSFRDLIVVTWETGCRPQESLRVESRHVDLKHNRWVFPKIESKGKRQPRVIYLPQAALEVTQRRIQQYPTGPLFRNSRGKPWTTDAVNCAFDRLRIRMVRDLEVGNDENVKRLMAELLPQLEPHRIVNGSAIPKSTQELRTEARRKVLATLANEHVTRYSLYTLRHAWATRALQSGLDGLTVAILMGHSDPSTLARVYQHLAHQPEHLLQQAEKAASQRQ